MTSAQNGPKTAIIINIIDSLIHRGCFTEGGRS